MAAFVLLASLAALAVNAQTPTMQAGWNVYAYTAYNDTKCQGTVQTYTSLPVPITGPGSVCSPLACTSTFAGSSTVTCPSLYTGWVPLKSTGAYVQTASYSASNCDAASLLANRTVVFVPTNVCQVTYREVIDSGSPVQVFSYAYMFSCAGSTATKTYYSDGTCTKQISSSFTGGCSAVGIDFNSADQIFVYSGTSCTSAATGLVSSIALTMLAAAAAAFFALL